MKTELPVEPLPVPLSQASRQDKPGVHAKSRRSGSGVLGAGGKILQPLPTWVWVLALVLAAWGVFSPNPVLTPCSVLILPVLASLLWFRGEPPVLLFACVMQWLQAALAVFYTNSYGMSLTAPFGGPQLAEATGLSLVGLLVLAVGMRLAQIGRKRDVAEQAERETSMLKPTRILLLYFLFFAVVQLIRTVAFNIPSLTQPLLALSTLRWMLVFLVAQSVLVQRRDYWILAVVVVIEFVTGILGYFSSFKGVFFVLLVVLPTARFLFKGWRLVQFGVVSAVVVALAIVWTVIKQDYREFLNQGTGEQVVLVPVLERLAKLEELANGLTRDSIEEGLDTVVLRISYVNFFSLTLLHVPDSVPHERGALWFGAIKHVLMPRFLFPNKPAIYDSERVIRYTGVQVAGEESGTSISLGYMAESYIDFGRVGMFGPIFLLGVFYGLIYRYFTYHYHLRLLGFAMATSILAFGAYTIETSNIKLVGGNLMGFLVTALFAKFGGPPLWKLVTSGRSQRPRRDRAKNRRRGPGQPDTARD